MVLADWADKFFEKLRKFRARKIGGKNSQKSFFWKVFAAAVFLILIFVAVDEFRFRESLKIRDDDARTFSFEISTGEKVQNFAQKLENENFIISAKCFEKYARRENLDLKFQAGKFFLAKNLTIPEVARALTFAKKETVKITIPEGFSVEQIDARLARIGLISAGEFQNCIFQNCDFSDLKFLPQKNGEILRGFLAADTFFIDVSKFSTKDFARRLFQTFAQKLQKNFGEKLDENFAIEILNKKRSLLEIVKMASILEKETRNRENRFLVADLFWRRFDAGISLGEDATVRFAVGKKTAAITADDLNSKSKFNTRKFAGLPPTAICNFGLESLRATIEPRENNFWYFLHEPNGTIHFSKTLNEHNLKKNEFLR